MFNVFIASFLDRQARTLESLVSMECHQRPDIHLDKSKDVESQFKNHNHNDHNDHNDHNASVSESHVLNVFVKSDVGADVPKIRNRSIVIFRWRF